MMDMEDSETPTNVLEFMARFHETSNNGRCEAARGLLLPCPFCAAPDFTKYPVFETTPDTVQIECICFECGRGAKPVLEKVEDVFHFQFFQTRGPAQPEWFRPRMDRMH